MSRILTKISGLFLQIGRSEIATKDKLPVIEATNITMCDFLARYEKVAEDT